MATQPNLESEGQPHPSGKKLINLIRGWPSPHILPTQRIQDATARVLSNPSIAVPALQYGPETGFPPLRKELARWLAPAYGQEFDPARLCITGGASQGLGCILQSFSDPSRTRAVWMAAPCYFLAAPNFQDAGFAGRMKAVPEDEDGIDLEALERGMMAEEENGDPGVESYKNPGPLRKAYRHIIYIVPTCANPSGKIMPLSRREGLVRLARKHDALVICDDVYDFLQWTVLASSESTVPSPENPQSPLALPPGCPLPRLTDIDRALGPSEFDLPGQPMFGHAVSNGSFSKLIGPGMRTGWAEGTPAFALGLSRTGPTCSGGAPSQLVAAVASEMLRAGDIDTHVANAVRPALRRRHTIAVETVKRVMGKFGVVVSGSDADGVRVYGGYFLWLTLREGGPSASEVADRAQEDENLIVASGELFEVLGDEDAARFPMNIRLCYSWEEEEDIIEGVERLGRVLERLELEHSRGESRGSAGHGRAGDSSPWK